MGPAVLNILAALLVAAVIISVWGVVQVISFRRTGPKKVGCSGPKLDEHGTVMCCKGDKPCDEADIHLERLTREGR